ncbi:hypothetical protein [Desulfospira joergensenii]|uniref:hypothetical protein n=1 Tax=Desulfospira joergensenii TaxID=53329 RepID=UPI0003B758AF|nr:hypothetical protein [Desulfospira joergensenii]
MSNQFLTQKTYLQKRAHNLGMTMMVMGACFFFYYLGLFGSVEGPLSPESIGSWLAGHGVTWLHVKISFFSFFILSLVWNHLINLVCFFSGKRRTCIHPSRQEGMCGRSVRKIKLNSAGGGTEILYVCRKGHSSSSACFHPLKKGSAAHLVWMTVLVCTAILMFYR